MLFSTSNLFLLAGTLSSLALPTAATDTTHNTTLDARAIIPETLSIHFNLYQKHVSVQWPSVAEFFLRDIFAQGTARLQTLAPDKVITTVNFASGPSPNKDLSIALTDVYLYRAQEKKKRNPRKQEDWADGYATFSVRRHGPGVPPALSAHPVTVKTWPVVHGAFLYTWGRIAQGISTPLLCVPCAKVPAGVPCRNGGSAPCTPLGAPINI